MFNVHIHTIILNSLFILKLFEKDCGILNPSWDWFQNTSLHSQILEKLTKQLATGSQILHLIVETELFSPDFCRSFFPNR